MWLLAVRAEAHKRAAGLLLSLDLLRPEIKLRLMRIRRQRVLGVFLQTHQVAPLVELPLDHSTKNTPVIFYLQHSAKLHYTWGAHNRKEKAHD